MTVNQATVLNTRSFPRIALIALLGGATAIAFSPIFVRSSEVGPTATGFWRLALALPFLWMWLSFDKSTVKKQPQAAANTDYYWLIAAGACFAGDLAAWNWSLSYTTVANSVLLANFAPVFVTLGSWLFFRQRPTATFITGMIVALVGAILLIGASFGLSMDHLFGDALALLTAVFYGGYILCVNRARYVFSTPMVMCWAGVVATVVLTPLILVSGEVLLPLTLFGWLVLAALALVSQVGGQGLIAYSQAHLPAAFSSVTLLIQPVLSTLFAWLILNEALGPRQALGGIVILAGIFVARRGSS